MDELQEKIKSLADQNYKGIRLHQYSNHTKLRFSHNGVNFSFNYTPSTYECDVIVDGEKLFINGVALELYKHVSRLYDDKIELAKNEKRDAIEKKILEL